MFYNTSTNNNSSVTYTISTYWERLNTKHQHKNQLLALPLFYTTFKFASHFVLSIFYRMSHIKLVAHYCNPEFFISIFGIIHCLFFFRSTIKFIFDLFLPFFIHRLVNKQMAIRCINVVNEIKKKLSYIYYRCNFYISH